MLYRYLFTLLFSCFAGSLFADALFVSCHSNLNVALPQYACTVDITPDMLDEGSHSSSGASLTMWITGGNDLGPGSYTVILNVSDGATTNSCWSTVVVEDKFTPVVSCTDKSIYLVAPDQEHTIDIGSLVTTTDNCGISYAVFDAIDADPVFGTEPYEYTAIDAAGNSSVCGGNITKVDAEPQNYCAAGRNAYFEHISNVRLTTSTNTFEVSSGSDGGYVWRYPTNTENVIWSGSTYTLAYAPGYRFSTAYHEYWRVYLDKNGDGDFTDSGELIHQWNGYGGNSFSFSNPSRFWGWSRIRIVMSYGSYGTPCGGGYGEVEDISVYLRPYFWLPPLGFRAQDNGVSQETKAIPTQVKALDRPAEPARSGEARTRIPAGHIPTPTSAAEWDEPKLKIFPNPAAAGQHVALTGLPADTEVIEIRDRLGRLIRTERPGEGAEQYRMEIPAQLPAGTYLLRGTGGKGWVRRLVVR